MIQDIFAYLNAHMDAIVKLIACFGVLFEIAPIKINPISSLLKWIGNNLNSEPNKKIDELSARLTKLDETVEENRKKDLKMRISDFASDLRHNQIKSESQFDSIVDLCDEYLDHGWNSKVKLDARFIKDQYNDLGYKVKAGKVKMENDNIVQ